MIEKPKSEEFNDDLTAERSCLECPSFYTATESIKLLKRVIGSPVCGTYGAVLGRPLDDKEKELTLTKAVARLRAKNCPSYGKLAPPVGPLVLSVALPDQNAVKEAERSVSHYAKNKSCATCKYRISAVDTKKEYGWRTDSCAIKGQLLLSQLFTSYAEDCDSYRVSQESSESEWKLTLYPEFDENFGDPQALSLAELLDKNLSNVDPLAHPTDKSVSDSEVESGIKAWRKIADPNNPERYTFLPIFRTDFFSEEEQSKIPRTGDDEHPELYIDHFGGVYSCAVMWTELDETPTLWGEPGTGKSELARHLAWLMGIPFERFSITARTELDELAGTKEYSPDRGTYFTQGRFVNAWNKPCVALVDEPNTGPPEVWQFLRPLIDNSKQLVLDLDGGRRISRSQDTYLCMAMNPAWDPRNYGTAVLGDADVSRLVHINVPLPPDRIEMKIIKDRVALDGWEIDSQLLGRVMKIAKDVRGLCTEGTLSASWGIRPQIQVARMLRWFDAVTAYRRVLGDYMEPEAAEAFLAVVRSHVPFNLNASALEGS